MKEYIDAINNHPLVALIQAITIFVATIVAFSPRIWTKAIERTVKQKTIKQILIVIVQIALGLIVPLFFIWWSFSDPSPIGLIIIFDLIWFYHLCNFVGLVYAMYLTYYGLP